METAECADFAFQLGPLLRIKIQEDGLSEIYNEMMLPLIPLVYRMETAERADFAFQLAPLLRKKIEEDGLAEIYKEIELVPNTHL